MTRRESRAGIILCVCLGAIVCAVSTPGDPEPNAQCATGAIVTNTSVPELVAPVVYVDQETGNDLYSGRQSASDGTNGPKKTIRGGLKAALADDVMVVKKGAYAEDVGLRRRAVWVTVHGKVDLRGKRVVLEDTEPLPMQPAICASTNGALVSAASGLSSTNFTSNTGEISP